MKRQWLLSVVITLVNILVLNARLYAITADTTAKNSDSLTFSGQASIWTLYNNVNELPLWLGGRYLPQLNYGFDLKKDRKLDFEVSANISGTGGFNPFDKNSTDGSIKLYRSWVRYSTDQLELRLGLQKLSFGSASMLRPLMWFDRIDPRDPLQLTDGVWGILGRYYFLNNANIWIWGLYGNETPSVWEVVKTNEKIPEFGGRLQLPVKRGEVGFTYHHRTADSRGLTIPTDPEIAEVSSVPENKFGIDGKFDIITGVWFEATWTKKEKQLGILTNQHLLNLGADYTFGIGNGLNVVLEHLYLSQDKQSFDLRNSLNFTGLSLNYPLGISDNLNAIFYYDWLNNAVYNFVSWRKEFKDITFYAMLFLNPENNGLPSNRDTYNLMGGKGIQLMIVYNH